MAGKDKSIRDAVKALGVARDAFAKAGGEHALAVEAALKACHELGQAAAEARAAKAAANRIAQTLDKLSRMKNPGSGVEFKRMLQRWLREQQAAAEAALERETARHQEEKANSSRAAAALDAAAEAARDGFAGLREAIGRIPADAVVPAQPAKLPDELWRVIRGARDDRSNYLSISQRDARFDPLVRDTLGQLARESRDRFEPDLLKKIVAEGLASDIEKITRRINRMGMPDLRRSVLAETYAELLDEALDDGGHPSRERAEDTVGTGEAVLAALDAKLDRFASILATRTATALGLDAPDGSYSHSIIKARVLGQI